MDNKWQQIRGDIIGGATAAVVALPLGIAFGLASGAGIMAGIYGSVFGGLVAAIFGGCGVQITGPTGAMIVVLASIISQYGFGGMLLVTALAGLMQILFGFLKVGKFVKYIPQPVVAGFTNGIAILFFKAALKDACGSIPITLITVLVIVLALRYFKKLPESLFGLLAGLLINEFFIHSPKVIGFVPFQIPHLTLGLMPFSNTPHLLMPALTIALLGSISALLSAEVTDEMLGVKHNSNKELIGQGLGNVAAAMVGGMPVSGAVARSGVNVFSGGRTKLSSILHAIFLMLMIILLGPIVKRIPLASLAAILMVASVRTADWKSIKLIPKARWQYGVIMMVTTILTVVKDLTVGVIVGFILASIAAIIELTISPRLETKNFKTKPITLTNPANMQVISLHGPLFFSGAEHVKGILQMTDESANVVLDLSNVYNIDETGALTIRYLLKKLHAKGKKVYIGGLNRRPFRTLLKLGILKYLDKSHVCRKIQSAINRATIDNEFHFS